MLCGLPIKVSSCCNSGDSMVLYNALLKQKTKRKKETHTHTQQLWLIPEKFRLIKSKCWQEIRKQILKCWLSTYRTAFILCLTLSLLRIAFTSQFDWFLVTSKGQVLGVLMFSVYWESVFPGTVLPFLGSRMRDPGLLQLRNDRHVFEISRLVVEQLYQMEGLLVLCAIEQLHLIGEALGLGYVLWGRKKLWINLLLKCYSADSNEKQ